MVARENKEEISKEKAEYFIPSSIFLQEDLSPYEAIVSYLKEEKKLTYREIGRSIGRDERNVWTIYNRAKKKKAKRLKGGAQ